MITAKSEKIGRLRTLCLNETEAPLERLKSGERLLLDFGPTEGSVPIIRKVITAFFNSADPQIATRAQKLKIKLAKAMDIRREAAKADIGPPVEESIVAGTSASQIPRPVTLTFSSLMEILEAEMGNAWRFDQEFAFETQLSVLESILDSKATIGGIQSLLTELKNSNGWSLAMSFPLIVRFAKEYLKQNGATPAPEDNAAALKFIADLEVEMSK